MLFTLEASLVEEGWKNKFKFFNKLKIEEEDGKIIIHRGDKDDDDEEDDEDWEELEEKRAEKNQVLYKKGKLELAEVLAEYGETLTGLRDDQWVGVAAFLKGSGYFVDKRISRLVLKAKVSDLRAYARAEDLPGGHAFPAGGRGVLGFHPIPGVVRRGGRASARPPLLFCAPGPGASSSPPQPHPAGAGPPS